jgi:ABC-type microcin C transport system duplicated ATPase subunit YejF
LIVDEVLAVGDTEFQKKCLGKIDEVSRRAGRTVLFVSHNLASIAELADRGSTLLVCRFPRLLLNVGRHYLRTWLQGPPHGGEIYETLDGVCVFDVVRIDQAQFADWRSDACTYHEHHAWTTGRNI